MAKGKSECAGSVKPTVGSKTPTTMISDWLWSKDIVLKRKVKFIAEFITCAIGIVGTVFFAGIQSTKLSFVRDLFDLPATLDSVSMQDAQIDRELSTLSEIRSMLDDIPSDLTKAQLVERMKGDPEYRKRVTERLVRLLGIRNEKMGSLRASLVHMIDARLKPSYTHELGTYTFRAEKIEEFVACVEDMRREIELWEQELLRKRGKLSR